VVLYELLCEALPYDVGQAMVFEATRIIREAEPKRPSTFKRALRGDVETIVLKALEKERVHRYQTVADFGGDIERYLDGDVILARPAGAATRVLKRIRRNPVVSGAVGVVFLMAMAFMGYLLFVSYPQLKHERDLAEAERKKAMEAEQKALTALDEAEEQRQAALEAKADSEEESENTKTINQFLEEMLSSADPFKEGGEVKVLEMLDRAAERIDREFPDKPEIEASLRHTLGVTYFKNGLYDAASKQLQKALEIRCRTLGEESQSALVTMNWIGAVYMGQGKFTEAEPILRRSLESGRRALGDSNWVTLHAMHNLGTLLFDQGRYGEAEEHLRKAMELSRKELSEGHWLILSSMYSLANLLLQLDRLSEAETLLDQVLVAQTRQLGNNHPNTLNTMNSLAIVYVERKEYSRAEPIYKEVLEAYQGLFTDEHPYTLGLKTNLANLYYHQDNLAEAVSMHREILAVRSRILGSAHPDTLRSLNNIAFMLKKLGKPGDAAAMLEEGLGIALKNLPRGHELIPLLRMNCAECLIDLERCEESEELLFQAYRSFRSSLGEKHIRTQKTVKLMIRLYEAWNKPDEAGEWRNKLH
jgi:tetratricopeptide (TPR) repeat protein